MVPRLKSNRVWPDTLRTSYAKVHVDGSRAGNWSFVYTLPLADRWQLHPKEFTITEKRHPFGTG
jgi:hypothetical protein